MARESRWRAFRLLLAALLLGVVANVAGDHGRVLALDLAKQRLLRLSDRVPISFTELLEEVKHVPLVFVGELHDQPSHHWAQLQVIRALHEADVPAAVGLEMFRATDQQALDAWVRGELSEEDLALVFRKSWGPPSSLYAAIFLYCREHAIPMIGLNLDRAIPRRVAHEGFDALPPEQARGLPPVTCDVDQAYEQFLRLSMTMGEKRDFEYEHFCEAQVVWDSVMARHALRFLERNPDVTLVVLAGSGHAWKRGIPARIQHSRPAPLRVILPESFEDERSHSSVEETDYLWLDLPITP